MPRFKIKDLMIDVVSKAEDAGKFRIPGCWPYITPHVPTCLGYKTCRYAITRINCWPYVTHITCCYGTIWLEKEFEVCPANSGMPIELNPAILYEMDPRDLAEMHELLLKEVAKVEAIEHQVVQQMAPQTLEEVELLESKFNEALNELETIRGGIKKRQTE